MPDDQPEILRNLGPLEGLPVGEARFCCVVGKAPTELEWNSNPHLWLTAEQAFAKRATPGSRWTGIGLMTGSKVGRLCWLDFDGEHTAPDGIVKSATLDFQAIFCRSVDELPPSPISISGRPGRFRALMRVPEEWVDFFKGFSIASSESPTNSFEFLYEKGGGKCFHAVIEGKHPDGQGWFYRWREGCSPAEVEIPDLPAWMIAGLVRHIANKSAKRAERESLKEEKLSGESPFDLLSPGKQLKLLRQMEPYWPFRGGEVGTGYAGHWDIMRRLVLSLAKGIDDWNTFRYWLEDGKWDLKNDWDGSRGLSSPVNGGTLVTFAQSLMRSDASGEEVAPWAAAWKLAKENGWKPPKWALPPREFDANKLSVDVTKKVEQLQEALKIIDAMESPLDRCVAYQNLSRALDVNQSEFKLILTQAYETDSTTAGGYLEDVLKRAKPIEVAIERLLAFNALTIVGSDGGVGKSALLYRMAEAAANGTPFAGSLETAQGNVLIIQKDESDSNLAQKNLSMQLNVPPKSVRVEFTFNAGMFPELRQWIRDHNAKYVLMDSMVSLFGGGSDLNEGEVGTYMYRLNALAAEEGCAIVLTHHLRKQGKDKAGLRKDVGMGDFYGSAFIGAGTSDLWAIIRDPESKSDEPQFLLKVIKPRTGVTQGGDIFLLSGSTEDLSFHVEQLNSDSTGVVSLRDGRKKLLEVLKKRDQSNPLSIGDLCSKSSLGDKQVRRLLKEMLETRRFGVQREKVKGVSGRPSYRYWAT